MIDSLEPNHTQFHRAMELVLERVVDRRISEEDVISYLYDDLKPRLAMAKLTNRNDSGMQWVLLSLLKINNRGSNTIPDIINAIEGYLNPRKK